MDFSEVRSVVNQTVYGALDRAMPTRYCPQCKTETPMALIETYTEEDITVRSRKFFRCLGCLSLFEEKIEKVDSLPVVEQKALED